MQNVLNIACHIQCPINLNFFDAPAWARILEIKRIIMYLRGLQNTQRPLMPSRWSLGVLIQAEIVSSRSTIQFPALLDERVSEESNCFPWFHVWIFLPWLLTGLLYSGLFFGEQRPQCSQTLRAKLGECHIFGQVAAGTLSGLGIWVEVLKVTSWTQLRRAYESTKSNPLAPSWPWDWVWLSDLTT